MMEVDAVRRLEHTVMETLKVCGERKEPPLIWTFEVSKCLGMAGLGMPSAELGEVLVSNLCFSLADNASLWKFLEQAITSRLCSSLHVLALLSSRVIPQRWSQPEAYRLYLELLRRYAFSFDQFEAGACREKIIKSVDAALKLSQTYEVHVLDRGHAFVLFFFSIVVGLVDSTLDDWGLQMTSGDRPSSAFGSGGHSDMEIDSKGSHHLRKKEQREQMRRKNSFFAVEVLEKLTENRKAMALLRLVHLNMPEKFNVLLQRVHFLETQKFMSPNMDFVNQLLVKLCANVQRALGSECQLKKHRLIDLLIGSESSMSLARYYSEAGQSGCWAPVDIFMEHAMDAKQLPATSSIDILSETIRTLQLFNRASWQETFLAIWISALRLVQREGEPMEGPIPHLQSRLSVLLSIVPLAIVHIVEDPSIQADTTLAYDDIGCGHGMDVKAHASKKHGLISSLQALGQFSGLLCPPTSIVGAANSAAAKAANFVSASKNAKDVLPVGIHGDTSVKTGGNMRHLIVEACIARNLVDTSAYFWPGYVSASIVLESDSSLVHQSPWSTFMEGAPLIGPLVNALITTPASSLAEVEKLYHIALNGSEEERPAAAKILCGASLSHGWNIQEHVVYFVVMLLSPPVPSNFSGPRSHLIDYMPMLHSVLFGCASVDVVHILSLHGLIPEVAASLMPLCEAFGSLVPTTPIHKTSTKGDEPSMYVVFSAAFLYLLRLWKFYRPPIEQCITGRGGAFGGDLTLEYLMLLHNSHLAPLDAAASDKSISGSSVLGTKSDKPVYVDFYPKLDAWYSQNKYCIASTIVGLSSGNPVHEVANKILNMIYWKMNKVRAGNLNSSASSSSSISDPSASPGDSSYQMPMLPAWEVLEAIPFVLEAILTACAHGRLSSRDLTTGLRDLVDFLPASLGAVLSYFTAEVTRGIWKPVPMNGTDWPSPAAMMQSVGSEMDEILLGAGVIVPSCYPGTAAPIMLPLPMAVLVSLTITIKLDKNSEYIRAVAGPALESCASACPWPSTLVFGSLWAQKVRRWRDFIVFTCCRSVFRQNHDAVVQLLRSCFMSFLGSHNSAASLLTSRSGISGLLGNTTCPHSGCPSVAPGFLYLRSCWVIPDIQYINDVIVELVVEFAQDIATKWTSKDAGRLRSTQASLASAFARAKEVAILGASLLCVAGGLQLVQSLYRETVPTWLLKKRKEEHSGVGAISCVMEGCAMAYLLVLSGSMIFGVGAKPTQWALSRRAQIVGAHMDFLAWALEGNITLGCDPVTWKSYVSGYVGLLVKYAPAWIQEVKLETLKKLANGLRECQECELAVSLLERGGVPAMGSVAELIHVIN